MPSSAFKIINGRVERVESKGPIAIGGHDGFSESLRLLFVHSGGQTYSIVVFDDEGHPQFRRGESVSLETRRLGHDDYGSSLAVNRVFAL